MTDGEREAIEREQRERGQDPDHYTMRISRQTVDKLGVKLYDRVSAVVAELVANAYDADAENVTVELPLATVLAADMHPDPDADDAFYIEVQDDGHGMTPEEADRYFLRVGMNRREHRQLGDTSRYKGRKVMGRKGIGKLAPFGICNRMEVISAGGPPNEPPYEISHFVLDYDEILQDTEEDYHPRRGARDRETTDETGTIIRLSHFKRKRVPGQKTFLRQLARRFGGEKPEFQITVKDIRNPDDNPPERVGGLNIPTEEETVIEVSDRPVVTEKGEELPVNGWVGMAKEAYKHEELAGVRIYARGKIVAVTRDFELMSGFTSEHTLRSYLVGEIHADWLDQDEGPDLIKTSRQDILWASDYGQAFKEWGAELLKEVGRRSREPRRKKVRNRFFEVSDFEEKARDRYGDKRVVDAAVELGERIGGLAAEDELKDSKYVSDLVEVILAVAPHKALVEAFQEFGNEVQGKEVELENLLDLFEKSRVAEMASYSQIAAERVEVVRRLNHVIDEKAAEPTLQNLIAGAKWLIEPTWTVLTEDQALRTFSREFERFWEKRHDEELTVAIREGTKRPDFTAVHVGQSLRIVELKAPGHTFNNHDFDRLANYVRAFRAFFEEHKFLREAFRGAWRIDLIADEVSITDPDKEESFMRFKDEEEVRRTRWRDFLHRAEKANEKFLEIREEVRRKSENLRKEEAETVTA